MSKLYIAYMHTFLGLGNKSAYLCLYVTKMHISIIVEFIL